MARPSFEIEPARAGDLAAVRAIVEAAYTPYIARIGKPPGPMLDDYAARIANGEVFVARSGEAVCGILVLLAKAGCALLDNVAVDPRLHGQGIGRVLIDFAEAEAARRGFAEIELYTHVLMTENLAMYPRLGYQGTGRRTVDGFDRAYFRKPLEPRRPT